MIIPLCCVIFSYITSHPLRNMVMGRYPAFYQKMAWSPSREVAVMAQVVAGDRRTITSGNLTHVSAVTKLNCAMDGWLNLKAALPVSEVPEKEAWRLGLLDCLMVQRGGLEREGLGTRRVVALISSLGCT